ncbi:hypothetical protein XMG59_002337 [Marinobacterium sp. xm-g-59]|uniref:UDP-N-acetylglucosamine acyltransferase n=1 Tax=Marinobacterium sp. xm-g-59 TaxID=2497748 RepID=UPI001569289D|nr:UDP-N-acetylglucosamine acyltransferase [Marinobacterium sp. xm-g-59]NRP96218.1 hypothetical protein [Marinobacterium sp. xm-g-59]
MNIRLAILSLVVIFAGCAQVPPLDFAPDDVLPTGAKIDRQVKDISIAFGKDDERVGYIEVGFGGNQYEASFKSSFEDALQEALIKSAVFNDMADRRVLVVAKVLKLETPSMGVNFPTDFVVRYQLLDTSSGKLIFTRDIESTGEVEASYAFMGAARYTEARNIAVRNNILEFITSLGEFKE